MINTIKQNNIPKLIAIAVVGTFISYLLFNKFAPKFYGILDLIQKSGNPEYNLIVFYIIIALMPVIIFYFISSDLKKKFYIFILLLPFTFRAQSFLYIEVYSVDAYIQKLSLTTMLVYALFLSLLIKNRKFRPSVKKSSINEKYIVIFFIFAASAQLINHDPKTAILLILASILPYVLLFYVIVNIINSEKDIDETLNYLVYSFLLGIFIRILTTKNFFFVEEFGEYVRLGGGPFGSAASYGGYTAIMLIICIYKMQKNIDTKYLLTWIIISVLIFIELLNTFTRGAFLSLLSVLILLKWKDQRKFFRKFLWVFLILISFLGPKIWELISYRGLYLDERFFDIPNVASRLNLWGIGLGKIFENYGIGVGIGNPVVFMQTVYLNVNRYFATDNFTLSSIYGVGIYATLFFYIIMFSSMKNSYKLSQTFKDKNVYSKFLFIVLVTWLIFANTTSTDLYYYFPYEASIIFIILLYLAGMKITTKKLNFII